MEGKRERAGMGLQMGMDKLGAQMENNSLRNQVGLASIAARMQGQGPKLPTVNERIAVENRVDAKITPGTPEFARYVGAAPGGQQLLMDLKNGRIKSDNPQFQAIVQQAKRRYMQDLMSGTRSSSGPTSYDQAASDLLGQ
jgi:hypothetical protein